MHILAGPIPYTASHNTMSQATMVDLVQEFKNLSAGTSGGEQQRQATASPMEDHEQSASISQSSDLPDTPITLQEVHRALEIVLEFLEQEKGSYKSPDNNHFSDGEITTMRSLVDKVELQTAMINKKP